MPRLAWAALTAGALGVVLTFSGRDPWAYVGFVLVVIAPMLAIAAFVRSRRTVTAAVVVVAAIPLAFVAWVLYSLARAVS